MWEWMGELVNKTRQALVWLIYSCEVNRGFLVWGALLIEEQLNILKNRCVHLTLDKRQMKINTAPLIITHYLYLCAVELKLQ